MSIYMLGIIRNSEARVFNRALIQGSLISFVVFIIFAKTGEAFFHDVLHVRFESFQIFGGIIFLVIGYRYVFEGSQGNDLVGYSKEQVINDILDKYERHLMFLHINRISPGKRPLFPDPDQ